MEQKNLNEKNLTEKREPKSWDKYLTNFLKSSSVESEQQDFRVANVEEAEYDDGSVNIRLTLISGKEKFLFDLNKTNATFVKNSGVEHPKDILGKTINFKKVLVFNPTEKKEVEGLRILKVK